MTPYELPPNQEPTPGAFRRHARWLIPLLVVDSIFLIWWFSKPDGNTGRLAGPPPPPQAVTNMAPAPIGLVYSFPTAQTNLLSEIAEDVFMPTASGRRESAHYGSVRTSQEGKYILPSFHEGIDIAPTGRDRKQNPTDDVFAAADGHVLYFNQKAGNSNYGKYIVLGHDDPVGETYTLYAHLADVSSALRIGEPVARGTVIGKMGNTASTGLPLARAHLHFEAGVINNRNFHAWFRKQKLKPDHGMFHGHNLTGINPLDVFRGPDGRFNMKDYLTGSPTAFTLVVRCADVPDYFRRYAPLWSGDPQTGGAIVMSASEGGVPQSGRPATEEEKARLGRADAAVLSADESIIGRNGLRLVTKRNGQWIVGSGGKRWLEILLYR